MSDHPQPEHIALWVLDPGSAELPTEARRHLDSDCTECASTAGILEALLRETREALMAQPPEELTDRLRTLVGSRAGDSVLVARLIQDTAELAGVRGEAAGARYLLFASEGYDLAVRIQPDRRAGSGDLRAHLHGPGADPMNGVRVRVLRDREVLAEGVTDELGEIHIPHFSNPPYFLELDRGPWTFRTPLIS